MFMLISLYSCTDNNENPSPEPTSKITIDEGDTHPVISQQGETISISFTAVDEWEAFLKNESDVNWLTISPTSGGSGNIKLEITVFTNDTEEERIATVILKCMDETKEIIVTQTPKDAMSTVRETLIAFYKATGGDNWKNNTNWCSDKPFSEWYGITTNQDGEVTRIHLDRNNLIGQLPENIGNLNKLNYLRLDDNYLYGELPESFYDLTELEYFSVSNFNFSSDGGTIVIDPNNPEAPTLCRNQLNGSISEKIGNLKNLYEFSAIQNMFEGELPKAIWKLPKLKALLLTHNKNLYGEIPEDIGSLKNLVQLWLDGNNFSGEVPKAITTLTNLEELSIGYNAFSGKLPEEIGNLKKLKQLVCTNNLFDGEIPKSICECNNLEWISLDNVDGVIWADGFVELENFNKFTGGIPDNISQLTKLQDLCLGKNQLTGVIPEGLYRLSYVNSIDLIGNQLSGSISEGLGNLSNLESINLSMNNITGVIPKSIGKLKKLMFFDIENNHIEGTIPKEVGGMTNLSSFWIYNNNIEGEIPLELLLLPNLSSISARLNRLEGTIPASLVKEGWNLLPQQDGYNLNIDYSRSNTFINSKEIVKKHLVGNNIIIENGDKTMAIPVRTKKQ